MKVKKRGVLSKFKDTYYVRIYQMAKMNYSETKISEMLGVSNSTFDNWKKSHPAIVDAIKQGRANDRETTEGAKTFRDFVFGRLSPEMQRYWTRIEEYEDMVDPQSMITELLRTKGKYFRQSLFIHALIYSQFNMTEACRRINITKTTLNKWMDDPYFLELMEQVKQVKKDFIEGALINLIHQGDAGAIIFANKTLNRDRGYGNKIEIEHSGSVQHNHVDITTLNLPIEVKRQILEAIREQKKTIPVAALPAPEETRVTVIPTAVIPDEEE